MKPTEARELLTTGLRFIVVGNLCLRIAKQFGYRVRPKRDSAPASSPPIKKPVKAMDAVLQAFQLVETADRPRKERPDRDSRKSKDNSDTFGYGNRRSHPKPQTGVGSNDVS